MVINKKKQQRLLCRSFTVLLLLPSPPAQGHVSTTQQKGNSNAFAQVTQNELFLWKPLGDAAWLGLIWQSTPTSRSVILALLWLAAFREKPVYASSLIGSYKPQICFYVGCITYFSTKEHSRAALLFLQQDVYLLEQNLFHQTFFGNTLNTNLGKHKEESCRELLDA